MSDKDLNPLTEPPRWELWGIAAGLGSGIFDLALFWFLGSRLKLSLSVTVGGVTCLFAATCAALGYVIGRLAQARRRAQADAQTIHRQLAALQASQRQLVENEKLAAIGRLAAGVAHEVRNPLGVIRASAAMVQEGFAAGDDAHRACQFICEEIDRLDSLITTLLTFARPAQLRLQRVALDTVLERALGLAEPELRSRGVKVHREGTAAPEFDADPDLLSQVVLGLLKNAAEALERGGHIALRVAATPEQIQLEVADSGPGLSPEQLQRVFEPFFTTKPRGTGLGLAMALRIIQTHLGVLQVVPGRGSGPQGAGACFAIRLPLRAATEIYHAGAPT